MILFLREVENVSILVIEGVVFIDYCAIQIKVVLTFEFDVDKIRKYDNSNQAFAQYFHLVQIIACCTEMV